MDTLEHPAGATRNYPWGTVDGSALVTSTPDHLAHTLTASVSHGTLTLSGGIAGAVYRVTTGDQALTVRATDAEVDRRESTLAVAPTPPAFIAVPESEQLTACAAADSLGLDWSKYLRKLGAGVTLTASAWTVAPSATLSDQGIVTGGRTHVKVIASVPGVSYTLTNRITASDGTVAQRSVVLCRGSVKA